MAESKHYRLPLTSEEVAELLTLLNITQYDMDVAANQSHDIDEVAAIKEQKAIIRKWIHRLSQLAPESEARP